METFQHFMSHIIRIICQQKGGVDRGVGLELKPYHIFRGSFGRERYPLFGIMPQIYRFINFAIVSSVRVTNTDI